MLDKLEVEHVACCCFHSYTSGETQHAWFSVMVFATPLDGVTVQL